MLTSDQMMSVYNARQCGRTASTMTVWLAHRYAEIPWWRFIRRWQVRRVLRLWKETMRC